jgi:hypothetical protein
MHYARDPVGGVEVFAIPLTITNHGARDAIIISLDLGVAPDKSGRPASLTFASAYGQQPRKRETTVHATFHPGPGLFHWHRPFLSERSRDGAANAVVIGKETYRGHCSFWSTSRQPEPSAGRPTILRDGVWCSPLPVGKADAGMNPEHISPRSWPVGVDYLCRSGSSVTSRPPELPHHSANAACARK